MAGAYLLVPFRIADLIAGWLSRKEPSVMKLFAAMLAYACRARAQTPPRSQERIDAAAARRHHLGSIPASISGPVRINKPLTLPARTGAEIRGNGNGSVITIVCRITLRFEALRVTGSGLRLSDDDAAIFVTGNDARIENCLIADSLHGIYLKKVSGAQILNNRIEGKTTSGRVQRAS